MSKSPFQIQVEEMLLKYINRFLRYIQFSHIPQDRKEILFGTFSYLLDEHDIVPDDVPNIGYLDDLIVFLTVAKHFVKGGQSVPGVCNPEEVREDNELAEKGKTLLYGVQAPSIDVLRKKGKKEIPLPELVEHIKTKYSHLGKVETQ